MARPAKPFIAGLWVLVTFPFLAIGFVAYVCWFSLRLGWLWGRESSDAVMMPDGYAEKRKKSAEYFSKLVGLG